MAVLHIYDPRIGSITIIDERKGLSNNAVMSILPDDEGDIWVATEHGINIISKAGTVLNSIYREDGTSYEKLSSALTPSKRAMVPCFSAAARASASLSPGH
ncbi:MAG: hypothetical protein H6559_32060 [Lewinellaceae bacterium]|nr:hypothetical protein [Lewinellaceae bacterium]